MEKEIKIDSINITIGKRDLSLSIEEAKKLHSALNDLFGAKIEYRDWGWRWSPVVTYTGTSSGIFTQVTSTNISTTGQLTIE